MMLTPVAEVDGVLLVDAPPMRPINLFARDLCLLVRMTGKRVLAEFNRHTLDVKPGMSAEDIHAQWRSLQLPFEKF